ncbi:hypothetical protein BDN70DRAFT_926032 [Pholiota conissans]|uniref:ARM repeat superfamily protein n=1 Tax=Pholiota conissans TaxID=109636 RepID=A0A9P6CS36_9AGAR|nr:hypothetical protein BDN70DRAFT_926032 [Pholiota conissans]
MAANQIDEQLNKILKKTQPPSDYKLLPDEIACLTTAFLATKSDTNDVRSKAYVVLSALCQGMRDVKGKGKASEDATNDVVKTFGPIVLRDLGETSETPLIHGITFLTALFQVDAQAASIIFSDEGLLKNLTDTVDITPSPLLCQEVAHLLGQACGHKSCRAVISPQILRWLEFKSRQSEDPVLQSAASVALIKLSKGAAADAPEDAMSEVRTGQADELAQRMVSIIVSGKTTSVVDTVEGLAYLSTEPTVKEILAKNSDFLKKLFALIPSHKTSKSSTPADANPTLVYGIVLVICNLTNFRPHLTEEQRQMEKLKQMAKAGKGLADDLNANSVLDDDEHVKSRIHLLVAAGVLPVFPAALAASDSHGVRTSIGKSLLNIVEEKENRGKVLQAGGAKVLQTIINQAMSALPAGTKSKDANVGAADLDAIQALAKLAITAAPVQVFGPNVGMMYDTIRPFSILLQQPSSNLLQRFESIMALTNLASYSAELASRIAQSDGLVDKVELLLLEEHVLVRRASVELICNLIAGSDDIFERYSGASSSSASKIHVLLALSDVDDLPTRLASSGALATVTAAPSACNALIALQFESHHFLKLMMQLIDPSCLPGGDSTEEGEQPLPTDPGLVHRGVVCVANVFQSIGDNEIRQKVFKQATEAGLLRALVQLMKGDGAAKNPAIAQPVTQALKAIMMGAESRLGCGPVADTDEQAPNRLDCTHYFNLFFLWANIQTMGAKEVNGPQAEASIQPDANPVNILYFMRETRDNAESLRTDDPFSTFKYAPKPDGDPWEIILKPELDADTVRCNAWKDEVQNLLIFAGLFSAVVTAFVVESYKFLRPDPNDAIIGLLFHIANGSAPLPQSVTSASSVVPFSQSSSSIRINVFWFISLILSLTTVLIGTICLQWLREHQSYPNFSAKEKFAILHMRLESLEVWFVPQIFAALPVLLQVAVGFFLAGLIDFVLPLGQKLFIPVCVVVGLTLFFLVVTTALPICQGFLFFTGIYPYATPPSPCAYKSPQSRVVLFVCSPVIQFLSYLVFQIHSLLFNKTSLFFRRYNVLPILRNVFRQPTWPAFDRAWLSVRDAYHQCILDKDPLLYNHQLWWNQSFPLSDVTQSLASVIVERPTAKHTDSFLHAAICCFQEISSSIWTEPGDTMFSSRRKDRRHHYFKQLYIPSNVHHCSLSEYVLHGGIYDYKNYHYNQSLDPYLPPTALHLYCQDETLSFLNILLRNHTSLTLCQYQLELWSHMMTLNIPPLTPLTPRVTSPARLRSLEVFRMPSAHVYNSPIGQRSVTLGKLIGTTFKLVTSQRIPRDTTSFTMWVLPEMLNTIEWLGTMLGHHFQDSNTSTQRDVIAQFTLISGLIVDHLNKELSMDSKDPSPSLMFDLSSVYMSAFLDNFPSPWSRKPPSEEKIADLLLVVTPVVEVLQRYRAQTSVIEEMEKTAKDQNNKGGNYSREKGRWVDRFSEEWWDTLFKHPLSLEANKKKGHASDRESVSKVPPEHASLPQVVDPFKLDPSSTCVPLIANHPQLDIVSRESVTDSRDFISEDKNQDDPVRDLNESSSPPVLNGASAESDAHKSLDNQSVPELVPGDSLDGSRSATEAANMRPLQVGLIPLSSGAAVTTDLEMSVQDEITGNTANRQAHSTIDMGSSTMEQHQLED